MKKFSNAKAILDEDGRRYRSEARASTPSGPRPGSTTNVPEGWGRIPGGGYRTPTGFEYRPEQGPAFEAKRVGVPQATFNTANTTPQSTLGSIFLRRLRERFMENDKRGRTAMAAPIGGNR